MLKKEDIDQVRFLVCHANCPDGIASAILLKDALPGAEVLFHTYGTEELKRLEARSGMLFCDLTPPRERAKEFAQAGAICLDHHVQQKDVVEAFGERGVYADERGVSGAVLAFKHVWHPRFQARGEPLAPAYDDVLRKQIAMDEAECTCAMTFAKIAGVRDTWQRNDPLWVESCAQAAALTFFPIESMLKVERPFRQGSPLGQWVAMGPLIHARHLERCAKAVNEGHGFVTPGGLRCVAFDAYECASDAADMCAEEVDVVVGFKLLVDEGIQKMAVTMRSRTGVDVGAMAKRVGGGGHKASAGFTILAKELKVSPFLALEVTFAEVEQRIIVPDLKH